MNATEKHPPPPNTQIKETKTHTRNKQRNKNTYTIKTTDYKHINFVYLLNDYIYVENTSKR